VADCDCETRVYDCQRIGRLVLPNDSHITFTYCSIGWNVHLAAAVPLCSDLPPFHVSLLSVEQNLCWPVVPHLNDTSGLAASRRAPAKDSKSIYADTATPAYTIYPSTRIPLTSRSCQEQVDLPFIPDNDGTTTSDASTILPIYTSILVRSPCGYIGA
jgi:mediator of RNA polymerase II transcription subunit 13